MSYTVQIVRPGGVFSQFHPTLASLETALFHALCAHTLVCGLRRDGKHLSNEENPVARLTDAAIAHLGETPETWFKITMDKWLYPKTRDIFSPRGTKNHLQGNGLN